MPELRQRKAEETGQNTEHKSKANTPHRQSSRAEQQDTAAGTSTKASMHVHLVAIQVATFLAQP